MTAPHDTRARGYEGWNIAARPFVISVLGLALLVVGALLVVRGTIRVLVAGPEEASPMRAAEPVPRGPRLQDDPTGELARRRADQQALLDSWEWIDRETGRARIPVDVAVDVLIERGLPVRESARSEEER